MKDYGNSVFVEPYAGGDGGRHLRVAFAVLGVMLVAGGCTSSQTPDVAVPTSSETTISESSTTTTSTQTTTSASTTTTEGGALINQAEQDLRFDYGELVRHELVDGVDWIWFDRYSSADSQGTELSEEPRWEMATDWHGGANVNPRLRSYPLAANARTLEIDPVDFESACGDLDLTWDFIDSDVPALLANSTPPLASLTFDADHRVVLIRDQRGC